MLNKFLDEWQQQKKFTIACETHTSNVGNHVCSFGLWFDKKNIVSHKMLYYHISSGSLCLFKENIHTQKKTKQETNAEICWLLPWK